MNNFSREKYLRIKNCNEKTMPDNLTIKIMTNGTKIGRTEITIETHSLTIIRTRGAADANLVRCRNCRTEVTVFRTAHAILIFQITRTELERLLQIGQIHFAENGDWCGNSLAAFFKREIRSLED